MADKYQKKFAFRVEINGLTVAKFQKCSALKATIAVVEHKEGGALTAEKELGTVTYDNVTLSRGRTDNFEIWEWFKKGLTGNAEKKDCSIVETDRAGTEINRWAVDNAQPISFVAGEWDNTSDENVIEETELAIEGFDRGGNA